MKPAFLNDWLLEDFTDARRALVPILSEADIVGGENVVPWGTRNSLEQWAQALKT